MNFDENVICDLLQTFIGLKVKIWISKKKNQCEFFFLQFNFCEFINFTIFNILVICKKLDLAKKELFDSSKASLELKFNANELMYKLRSMEKQSERLHFNI